MPVAGRFAGLVAIGFVSFLLLRKRAGGAKAVSTAPSAEVVTPVQKPKAKAGPPPPPKGKAAGKGKGAARPKAATADEAFLSPRSAEFARFGKRIHWVKPSCEEPQQDTIFGELKMSHTTSEEDRTLQFDKNLMDAMFTPRSARSSNATPRKSWTGPKPQGVCLLDNSRAHNIAIVLTKLAMSTKELCNAIRLFDTGSSWLKVDHVELLTVAMPSTSEATKLLANKDKEETLRDVERRMMPLCDLSPARVKVMKFALSYQSLRENLVERCKVLQLAAEESRNSRPLRELLAIVLEAGNYINGGDPAGSQGERVRAFGIESLQSLANFKVGCISCMHFLCITMRASDRRFLSCLEDSLRHIRPAAKERFNQLRSDVEGFLGEVNFAAARLREMNAAMETEVEAAKAEAAKVEAAKALKKAEELEGATPQAEKADEGGTPDGGETEQKKDKAPEPEPAPWPTMSEEELARERLSMIVSDCVWKAHQLRLDLQSAEQASADVQNYFCVASPRKEQEEKRSSEVKPHRVPPEQFYGYISGFLDMVKGSWNEIEANPARWRQFFTSADGCKLAGRAGAGSFAKQISESYMQPGKDGDLSPRKRGSTTTSSSASGSVSGQPASPRLVFGPRDPQESPKVSPSPPVLSPRSTPKASPQLMPSPAPTVPEEQEPPLSPRRRRRGNTPRGSVDEAPPAATTPRLRCGQEAGVTTPRLRTASEAAAGATTPRLRTGQEDLVNHASPPAKVAPKIPKLNLKRQSPRAAVSRKWSDLPDTDRSLKGFIAAMHSPANKAAQSPKAPTDPFSTSSSSASIPGDKAYAEDSNSDSSETDGEIEGRAPETHDQGYTSTSASSEGGLNGRESPASASSPNFAPVQGSSQMALVPPLKMSNVFGARGVTPSFGGATPAPPPVQATQAVQPLQLQSKRGPAIPEAGGSPRRLLSARSGEDTGTARKMVPSLATPEAPDKAQSCEFHQMNDSTDCEYHKLADSDTDMTQSDEEFISRRSSARTSEKM
mmetsp:Transcript_64742/g.152227  ORF Transcript_64742/g.152227 Transcript_64742/m.152227 type:complete len:1007 (-) Transcript_64742:46-3066(-)